VHVTHLLSQSQKCEGSVRASAECTMTLLLDLNIIIKFE